MSDDKELSDASSNAKVLIVNAAIEQFSQFLEERIKSGERNGLLLEKRDLQRLKKLEKKIQKLKLDFSKCLREDTSNLLLHKEDLNGVPSDTLESLKKDGNGTLRVPMNVLYYLSVLKYCSNPKTRYLMMKTYNSKCEEENVPRLEKIVTLRHEKAELLGKLKMFSICLLMHFCV